mmetsp:Transcript_4674/g.9142  ORF Transcript_4674/g.9142 Transcript_4674/m.9142 type:complete len:93 (+) Transcript_4674:91-369(+)
MCPNTRSKSIGCKGTSPQGSIDASFLPNVSARSQSLRAIRSCKFNASRAQVLKLLTLVDAALMDADADMQDTLPTAAPRIRVPDQRNRSKKA